MSKCWVRVSSFVPSLGLISFQGVGFSFVQTTGRTQGEDGRGVRVEHRGAKGEGWSGRTSRAAGEAGQVPARTNDDDTDDSVAGAIEPRCAVRSKWRYSHRRRLG